jgi:ribosomal protein L7/L12
MPVYKMSRPIPDDELAAIRSAYFSGRKIEAIKLYRQASGAGLAEAKRFVESLSEDAQVAGNDARTLSDASIDEIQAALFAGKKIDAIKRYRNASGEGLKEAKEFIDALEAELRRTQPTRFTVAPAKGCGTTILVLSALMSILVGIALGIWL